MRCVWPAGSSQCRGCAARKVRCVEQMYGDIPRDTLPKTKTMRERIAELEWALNQLIQRIAALGLDTAGILQDLDFDLPLKSASLTPGASSTPTIRGTTSSFSNMALSDDLFADLDNAPLLSLLDNDILCSERSAFGPGVCGSHFGLEEKYNRILSEMRPLAPNPQTVAIILQHSRLQLCLLSKNFPSIHKLGPNGFDHVHREAVQHYLLEGFRSDDIATVTRVLITLATCIQQFPGGVDLGPPSVRESLDLLQRQYIDFAEAFLAPDEGIAGSIEGLECMLTQTRYYINAGTPRKAWVVFRRAATFAQLLGSLHSDPSDHQLDMRKRALWLQLWQVDKNVSLLLGLPYMLSTLPFEIESDIGGHAPLPPRVNFMFKLGEIAARVIDRNRQNQADVSYSATVEMDQDLERCKAIMPSSWWDTVPGPDMALEAVYDMCIVKFWYHILRAYIQLPFVLKSSTDPKHHFSRMAALESSREMIGIYEILRSIERPIISLCNMMDFQVLTAALIIILQLLGNPHLYTYQQQEQDWLAIDRLVRVMKRAAQDMPDTVAAQAARLLEDLMKLRHDVSGHHQSFHAVVPYFGEIRIRKRDLRLPQESPSMLSTAQTHATPNDPLQFQAPFDPLDTQMSLFDFNNFDFGLENSQVWPGTEQEWSSMVDFTLQDGWDWDWNETGPS